MRRALSSAALLVGLASCAGSPSVRPNALEQLPVEFGLDAAAAKGAVESFLHGYANADRDDGEELLSVTGNGKILRWAQWVGVQNRFFPGDVEGDLEVRNLQFVDFLQLPDGNLAAQVDTDASITFQTTTVTGRSESFSRQFVGPFILFRRDPGEWAVLDGTREGQSIDRSIYPVEKLTAEAHGVSVRLDSVFGFSPTWQVNLIVANHTGRELSLRARDAVLTLPDGSEVRGRALAVGGSLSQIPDGPRFPGCVIFEGQDSTRGVTLKIGRAHV